MGNKLRNDEILLRRGEWRGHAKNTVLNFLRKGHKKFGKLP